MYGSNHKVLCLCCVLTAIYHFATYLNNIFAFCAWLMSSKGHIQLYAVLVARSDRWSFLQFGLDRNILKTIEQMPMEFCIVFHGG